MAAILVGAFVLLLTALVIVMGSVYDPFAFSGVSPRKLIPFFVGLLLTIWCLVWFILGIKVG